MSVGSMDDNRLDKHWQRTIQRMQVEGGEGVAGWEGETDRQRERESDEACVMVCVCVCVCVCV